MHNYVVGDQGNGGVCIPCISLRPATRETVALIPTLQLLTQVPKSIIPYVQGASSSDKSEVSSRPAHLHLDQVAVSLARRHPVKTLLDTSIRFLRHLVQGQSVLDPLNGPRHGRRHPLDASLDGVLEEGDVAFPARSPLEGLSGETLLCAGDHQVEGSEGADAGGTEAEDFTSGGGGNADRHVCGCVSFGLGRGSQFQEMIVVGQQEE
jgi:hypothetical protein